MSHMREIIAEWEEMDDATLVEKAREGSREAFGELVRRHRSKVYGYARSMVQEAHAAEDIVQDALIRAFLHLGKLVDAERFLPWVHRIVRNQAMTRLSKERRRQETTFSALETTLAGGEEGTGTWGQLDYVLKRVSHAMEKELQQDGIPEARLIRLETQRVLMDIIACLKPRERQIFESHFFDQLSPQEIAREFSLTSANVYQILSRSRKKVIQERILVTVDAYMKTRKDWGTMGKTILGIEAWQQESHSWSTAGSVLHALAKAAGKNEPLTMVMGLTGLAFRIQMLPGVHIAGPTAFDFADVFRRGLQNLGLSVRIVDGMKPGIVGNVNLLDETAKGPKAMLKRDIHQALPEALDLIHHAVDRGYPVLAWDLCIPEFGMIYGYDDEQKKLYLDECGRKDTLSYENLGRGVMEEIFVLAADAAKPVSFKDGLRGALRMIAEHYDGKEPNVPAEAVKGLKAYDVWLDAFRSKGVEANGNGYNVAVVGDSRKYAAGFLEEAARIWEETEQTGEDIGLRLNEAAETYHQIAQTFAELHALFPYPEGGRPNDAEVAAQAIALLEKAKKLETLGAEQLKNLSKTIN